MYKKQFEGKITFTYFQPTVRKTTKLTYVIMFNTFLSSIG